MNPLYAILDADIACRAGWTVPDLAAAYIAGGARFFQLRAKYATGAELLDLAAAVVELAHQASARVVINDRADIARLAGADGVHVGQDDLAPAAVRGILDPAAIVGLSTHTAGQVNAALDAPISYLAIGPVYQTATKTSGYQALGPQGVKRLAAPARQRKMPVVAIGGITLDQVPELIAAGADSVAVISDLLAGNGPEARVRAYLERLSR